jgi:two-component system nitrogen regulation sensor histidine kinase NtrY
MPDTRIERFNVFEIINRATTIFKQTDNVDIIYNPGPPFFIDGDQDQVLRCFNNLLKNAIEAIPTDRKGRIEILHHFEARSIWIDIKDNGGGIPDSLKDRIFVPNFTTKSSGTGLGLAFVKSSIENAGGTISFETETGVGTIFHINLPAAADVIKEA